MTEEHQEGIKIERDICSLIIIHYLISPKENRPKAVCFVLVGLKPTFFKR